MLFHLIVLHQLLLQMLAPSLQWLVEVGQQQAEVIGSHPTEQGTRQYQLLQPLGHLAEQAVGNPDPEAIVDFTKMVQIDQHQRGTASPQMAAGLQEPGEFEQPGQTVVVLLLLQLCLSGAQTGYVAPQRQDPEGVTVTIGDIDPGDLHVSPLPAGIQQTTLAMTHPLRRRQPERQLLTQHLIRPLADKVEECLIALQQHPVVIIETDQIRNGIEQKTLQQLLLFDRLFQALALGNLVDHPEYGTWLTLRGVKRDLVYLHPTALAAPVAMQLVMKQGNAIRQQLIVLCAKYIAPRHLCITLAKHLGG